MSEENNLSPLPMKYEEGIKGEVTRCHATQLRTGTESPFVAEGQTGLQKPWISNVLSSSLMLSSNNGEKAQVATSHLQNDFAAYVCPLCTLTEGCDHMAGCTLVKSADCPDEPLTSPTKWLLMLKFIK